jgi:hypothetical protein
MKNKKHSIFIIITTLFLSNSIFAQLSLDVESGAVFNASNDVRISGDQGTLLSLTDDLKSDPAVFLRLRASYSIKSRHNISLLYAPLTTKSEGKIGKDVLFEGVVFDANTQLMGTYKFNSYRLTYRYDIVHNPKLIFGLGFTAKIRDASIGLSSPDLTSVKTNVGFVPIINFRLWWKATDKFGLLLDGDALAAPQGRAEDVQLAATYTFSENLGIRAGYRILEGGADNDEVYNFSLFHYASVGVAYTFKKKVN